MKLIQDILIYAFLGIIQGISKPIPISSSGHLIIFKAAFEKFGWNFPNTDITFEILVNTGSLFAIIYYYRKDILKLFSSFVSYIHKPATRRQTLPYFRYCILLILATIPAAIFGVIFNDYIENTSNNIKLVGCTLLITATLLMCIHIFGYKGKRTAKSINLWDALRMGIFQVFALLPGISRSGATICGGMLSGLSQKSARDFSFLMFMPVSIGSIALKLGNFISNNTLSQLWLPYLISFITSAITTYIALHILFKILEKKKMNYFSFYCFIIGLIAIILL